MCQLPVTRFRLPGPGNWQPVTESFVNSHKPFYMKKITLTLCLLAALSSWAHEKFSPAIKQGTKLKYSAWIMKNKSLESALKGYWGEPSPGTQEEVPDDKSILVFSKAQWDMLQKDKTMSFDQQTFGVKAPTEQTQLKLAGKPVDAFLLESSNGTTRIWILNNAAFPVLLKIEGNTLGADLTINSVE
jgi:hypothetical protein